MLLLALLACPAENLGIEVPPVGVDAIAIEDLKRDTRHLSTGDAARVDDVGQAAREAFLTERWAQMDLAVDGACGRRAGTGDEWIAIVAEPGDPRDPFDATAGATAITLAKTLVGRPADPRGAVFCVGDAPHGAAWVLTLGPGGGSDDVWSEADVAVDVRHAGPGDAPDPDFRRLEQRAAKLVPVLTEALEGR